MKFSIATQTFGSRLESYSNNVARDVDIVLSKIAGIDTRGSARHVVFIGETHGNRYDEGRRAAVIMSIHLGGRALFPNGVPAVIAERFEDVDVTTVNAKEPQLPEGLPPQITAIGKSGSNTDTGRGYISLSEQGAKMASSFNQIRNHWFINEVFAQINRMKARPVPIVIACGDDHAPYLVHIFSELSKSGYGGDIEIIWHHFISAPETVASASPRLPPFDITGWSAAGFVRGFIRSPSLIKLEGFFEPEPFKIELVPAWATDNQGWAIYLRDRVKNDARRAEVESGKPHSFTYSSNKPLRVVRITALADDM
jgi:hypothetical protein